MLVFRLFVIASIVMGVSHTITKERVFQPLRDALGGKRTWLGYLAPCPYCASHWVAFIVLPLTRTSFVEVPSLWAPLAVLLRWFLSSVFVATVASYLRVFFYLVDESQGLLRRAEKLEETELRRRGDRDSG